MKRKLFEKGVPVDVYHARMEALMEKELAEIEAELAAHPEITCQPVSPKIKERIDAIIDRGSRIE